ncbi:thiolase family protein [Vibrio sp. ZSDZ34]|uniref:Thiolase family protein n=1 Tax=Vibrio gelatinilyticus TaxID=2893468 RepID=A0A9X1WG62_9VIBR|nr:thiolase family protein [Vibrio gelatinilyticus]MCJ2376079.1 thiolase family protein [Vibrio gelatinilyticus]
MEKAIWIVSAKRTPLGSFQGELRDHSAPHLGGLAIKGVLEKVLGASDLVDEVFMGCVLPAGCGQAPARQAALHAELPYSVGCTTINKVCGSGMKSIMLAYDLIRAGSVQCVIAGGMESMTNAPYLLQDSRNGMRMGHKTTHDHMFLDGLQDAYEGELMGVYAQRIADACAFSREEMDQWAIQSVQRARKAQDLGLFADEMVAIEQDMGVFDHDEHPQDINLAKIPTLRSVFAKDGTITAANSSAISDGAAALLLLESKTALQHNMPPLAIIKGHTTHARKPHEYPLAPVYAIQSLLSQLDWSIDEVNLWEINEAFAVVTQIAVKKLGLDPDKVNVKGGACALGHPIGASGARIVVTLLHSLRQLQAAELTSIQPLSSTVQSTKKTMRGIACLCIGGGEATAIAIEIPST